MSLIVEQNGPVAVLTLDRPKVHNAFDEALIARLAEAFDQAGADPKVRVVLLAAQGVSFCAGADLDWMRRMAEFSHEENLADARALAALMRAVDTCPKPTVARIQGSAFGGGVGLIAACDIAIAVPAAEFAMTEVRLGLLPSVVGPYVRRAIGSRQARRFFLTGERFSAADALSMGLVHKIVEPERLDGAVDACVADLLKGGPRALEAAKALSAAIDRPLDAELAEDTARRIAEARGSAEGREGIAAFLARRKPGWVA